MGEMGQEISSNLGSCFYVIAACLPEPIVRMYNKIAGDDLDKINPQRAKLSKYEKDQIDQELVIVIKGETTKEGKWTHQAEAEDVRKLINLGAANTVRDRAGGTPLHECCLMGLVDHAKAILDIYPNEALKRDRFGRTPMQYAIEAKKMESVEMLLLYKKPVDLEIYKWLAVNKTEFDFASRVFNLLEPEQLTAVIKQDDKTLSFEQRKGINEQLKPLIKMYLE